MLKLVKTSLQSTMGNDRLTSLALMLIHRDVELHESRCGVEEFFSSLFTQAFINQLFFRIVRPKVILDAVNIKSF